MTQTNPLITIILPLWDRSEYSVTWIENNLFDDFNYIIADGSRQEKNHQIFKCISQRSNINYIRFPADTDTNYFKKKMLHAVSEVNTPYVMTCDNDDFLVLKGILSCVDFLSKNDRYGFCNGGIRSILEVEKQAHKSDKKYQLRYGKLETTNLNNKENFSAISGLFRPYKNVWYAVYRTNIYEKIWGEIVQSDVDNIFLIEYLQSQLAFCLSHGWALGETHYLRLGNPTSSSAKDLTPDQYPSRHGIYFDDNYRAQVLTSGKVLAKLLAIDEQKIYDEYRYFYGHPFQGYQLRDIYFNKIINYFYSILMPALGISNVRSLVRVLD